MCLSALVLALPLSPTLKVIGGTSSRLVARPFKGVTFGQRVFCVKRIRAEEALHHQLHVDIDDKIGPGGAEFGYYKRRSSRFSDTPTDLRTVHLIRLQANYMYRISPLLDLGAGGGVIIFTGDGFDSQSHPVVTPLSVTFTPLGFIRDTPKATRWGRFVRVNFSETWVFGDIKASDFGSTSTYLRTGEFNRKFGIGVDIGSLISH